MDAPEFLPELGIDEFFRTYWRQRPLHVKGGGEALLGRRWSEADFDEALAAAREAGPTSQVSVKERPGDVVFVENVSAVHPDLAARMGRVGRALGTPEPWCDTIRTYLPSGIGAHYDHSDNFVLQQEGTKEWSLAPAEIIPREDYVRRMLGFPGVGGAELPPDPLTFTLEPGDLLYIPLMWVHSGVSTGPSLSLSVVCPTVTLYAAVLPLLARVALDRRVGHQPLEAVPDWLPAEERATAAARLDRATRALVGHLAKEPLLADLARQQAQLFPGLAAGDVPGAAGSAGAAGAAGDVSGTAGAAAGQAGDGAPVAGRAAR